MAHEESPVAANDRDGGLVLELQRAEKREHPFDGDRGHRDPVERSIAAIDAHRDRHQPAVAAAAEDRRGDGDLARGRGRVGLEVGPLHHRALAHGAADLGLRARGVGDEHSGASLLVQIHMVDRAPTRSDLRHASVCRIDTIDMRLPV